MVNVVLVVEVVCGDPVTWVICPKAPVAKIKFANKIVEAKGRDKADKECKRIFILPVLMATDLQCLVC